MSRKMTSYCGNVIIRAYALWPDDFAILQIYALYRRFLDSTPWRSDREWNLNLVIYGFSM